MQLGFGFGADEVIRWRQKLGPITLPHARRAPVGQLVKSLISAKTYDAVSLAAYRRLAARFGSVAQLARAEPTEVASVIDDVTFAQTKAAYLIAALRIIDRKDRGFALTHLGRRSLRDALTWLERLPGVGRKVSASALNASTLARPVFIVDTHVLRVLRRMGFVLRTADYRAASEAVTVHQPDWSGADFLWFHVALKRLGQTICCWDTPLCAQCPLGTLCKTGRSMLGQG